MGCSPRRADMFRVAGIPTPRRAFTLIEVLVVVAIIALLVAVLLPSLRRARSQARRVVCLNNLHQLSIGLYSYQAENKSKPPRWETYAEQITDGVALWVSGSHATRLGMLYPKQIGKEEKLFFCPDADDNGLLARDASRTGKALYPWENFGTNKGWAYGSYEYRPRYYFPPSGTTQWIGGDLYSGRSASRKAIAADGFAGSWDSFGPFPAHTPIQDAPRMLYYNVAYTDGGANAVKDFVGKSETPPFGSEFQTRCPPPVQSTPEYTNSPRQGGVGPTRLPPEYTPLNPYSNPPLPTNLILRQQMLNTTNSIERGWTFFDSK